MRGFYSVSWTMLFDTLQVGRDGATFPACLMKPLPLLGINISLNSGFIPLPNLPAHAEPRVLLESYHPVTMENVTFYSSEEGECLVRVPEVREVFMTASLRLTSRPFIQVFRIELSWTVSWWSMLNNIDRDFLELTLDFILTSIDMFCI